MSVPRLVIDADTRLGVPYVREDEGGFVSATLAFHRLDGAPMPPMDLVGAAQVYALIEDLEALTEDFGPADWARKGTARAGGGG